MQIKFVLCLLGFSLAASGSERILYEGSGGLSPTASGWALLATPFFGNNVTETVGPGDVVLDTTTTTGDSGGYFSNLISPGIVLDRQQGFTLGWRTALLGETHLSNDRAGFNVLVVTTDLMALELGVWSNEVWAQHDVPLFTHGEGVAFATGTMVSYELDVLGTAYTLRADGNIILSGSLRDYSAFDHVAAGLPLDPYETANLVFFGDDTSSAAASVRIEQISLVTPGPFIFADTSDVNDLTIRLNPGGDRIEIVGLGNTVLASNALAGTLSITIDGQAGDDTLTVDFANGSPIPGGGLSYSGGAQDVADTLRIVNGAFGPVTIDALNGHDGVIDLDGDTLTYTGLEPVDMSGSTATDLHVNLPASDDHAVWSIVTGSSTNRLASSDAVPTFESTDFIRPTGVLSFDGGPGVDSLTVSNNVPNGRLNITSETVIVWGNLPYNNGAITTDNLFVNPTNAVANQTLTLGNNARATVSGTVQLGGHFGANFRGNVTQNAGSRLAIGGDLVFGGMAIDGLEGGTYNLHGGELVVTGSVIETTGTVDAAQFQLNGGTVDIGGDILVQRFALAQSAAGNFAYTIPSNQSVRTTGTLSLGAGGTAELTLEQGGATLDTMNAYIGEGLAGMGTVHVRNGRTWNVEQFLRIGHKGTGVVNLVSGTINSEALSGTKGIRMAELSTGDATLVMGLPGGSGSADPVINSKIANFETSDEGRGRVLMHHGTVNQLGANIIVGQVAGSEGTFTLMDGLVNVQPGSLRVGNTGTGLFEQVSGDVVVGATLDLGNAGAARGTYLMHGGTLSTTNSLIVGNVADGRFELNDGTINVGTSLVVGNGSGGQGLLVMTNGLLNVGARAANNLVIGNANTNATTGIARIEGGVVNLARGLILAQQGTGSSGTLIVGTADGSNAPVINMQTVSGANFETANKGTGTFLFHSGLITMNNNNFITGQSLGSVAQVSIGGGTAEARLEMTGGNGLRDWNVNSGQGIVSILSNGVVNVGRDMNLGNNTNLTSGLDLTLDGGVLRLGAGGSAGNINFRAGGPLDQVNLLDGVFHSNGGQINLAGSSTTNFHFSGGILANFSAVSNGSLTQDGGLLRVGDTNLVRSFVINGGNDYLQNSGVLEIDIVGPGGAGVSNGHDRVVLSGDLGLAGSLVVNSPHTANPGDAFTIIQNNGTNLVNGTFSGLPEGTKLIAGANVFSITYTGGSGNEVVLTATDPALEIVALPPLREVGGVRLFFTGVPNTAYTIQFADNTLPLPHTWQVISTLVSGPAGALELLHVPASASEFYRAIR